MDNKIFEELIKLLPEVLPMVAILTITHLGFEKFISKYLDKKKQKGKKEKSYSEKLSELTDSLNRSSKEVDNILSELANVASERERTLNKLESDLLVLEGRESETKKRIKDLENVPLAAVEHFAKLTSEGEKKSAKRDYLLFAAGVIVSTIVAIILKLLGWA